MINNDVRINAGLDVQDVDLQNIDNAGKTGKTNGNTDVPEAGKQSSGDTVNLPPPARNYSAESQASALQSISGGMAELLVLLSKLATEDKQITRDMNIQKINNVAQQQQAIADKIRSTAGESLAMGLVSAGLQIVSGAVTLGLSAAAARQEMKGLNQQQEVQTDKIKLDQRQIDAQKSALTEGKHFDKSEFRLERDQLELKNIDAQKLKTEGNLMNARAQASGTFLNASSSAVNSGADYNRQMAEAENKEKEASIATLQSTMEALKSHAEVMNDLSNKAKEAAAAILRAETDAQRAILS
jgi:hypothetical protein